MARLAAGLALLLTLAIAPTPAASDPPAPETFDYAGAERGFAAGLPSESETRALLAQAGAALARRADLARDAAQRGEVTFAMAAQAKVENALGLGASAGFGHSGGTLQVGHRWLRFKGTADPNDRSVTSQVELGVRQQADGSLVKLAYSVKLEYGDNRTYLRALGMDARNVPGMGMVVSAMERLTGGRSEELARPGGEASVAAAVGGALRDLVPDMFHAATEFQRWTVGAGVVVENGTGDLSITYMKQEQLERGQRAGEGRAWSEVGLGAELDATLRAGRAGTLAAGVAVELKRTYGDPPPVDRDANAAAAEMFAGGDLEGLARRARERLAPVLDPERWERALEALERQGEAVASGVDRILAVSDEDLGGVRLQYDPTMLASVAAPARAARLLDRLVTQLDAGAQGFVALSEEAGVRLVAHSLTTLLASGADSLAPVTRLRGCLVREGDLLLLGEVEPGVAPLSMDVLAVAARNVWREGCFPFISLDPDPADLRGPQQVRVGGILASQRDTRFVRVMLDADYDMKRIDLGLLAVDVPGFRCLRDLLSSGPPVPELTSRAWLSPMRSTVADVWTWRQGAVEAYLFDTRVQVMSESMRRTREGLAGGGEVDPLSARAADEMTAHFDAIARRVPSFGELRGLFSAVKLCATLRARGVSGPTLERLAERAPGRVEIPASYAGLHVEDGSLRMSGGALSRVRLSRSAFRAAPEIAAVLGAEAGAAVDATFPTTVGLSAEQAFEAGGEMHFNRGLTAFAAAEYADAERHMDAALERDEELHEARLVRATCRLARGDGAGALADVDAVLPHRPEVVALRALLHVFAGRDDRARADLEAAARGFPEDDDVTSWRAQAHLYLFELPEAEALAITLLRRRPNDPAAQGLWELLAFLHRAGPAEARARVGWMREVAPLAMEAFATGSQALSSLDFLGARESLTTCLKLLDEGADTPAARALHLRERCELGLVFAQLFTARVAASGMDVSGAEVAAPEAQAIAARLLERHPDWPSAHMVMAMALPDGEPDRLRVHLDAVLTRTSAGDPLFADVAVRLGTGRTAAWLGLSLVTQAARKKLPEEVGEGLLRRTVEALGDTPEGRLLAILAGDAVDGLAGVAADLRAGLLALAAPLPDDPVTVQAVGFCFATYLGMSSRQPAERERRLDVARWFLRAGDVNDLPPPVWLQLSTYRLAALQTLAEDLDARRAADPELRRLRLWIANRRAPLAELRSQVKAWKAGLAARAREAVGPFLAGWLDLFAPADEERSLCDSAAGLLAEVPEGPEREAYLAELEAWRAEIEALPRVARQERREEPPDASVAAARREALLAAVGRLAAAASRPADVHMLGFLSNLLGTTLGLMEGRDPQAAAAMRALVERMSGGLRGGGLTIAPRDWVRWTAPSAERPAPAASPTAAPSPRDAPATSVATPPPSEGADGGREDGMGPPALAWILALGLLLALGTWSVLRRGRGD